MEKKGQGLLAELSRLDLSSKLSQEELDLVSKKNRTELALLFYGLSQYLVENEIEEEQLLGDVMAEAVEEANQLWNQNR